MRDEVLQQESLFTPKTPWVEVLLALVKDRAAGNLFGARPQALNLSSFLAGSPPISVRMSINTDSHKHPKYPHAPANHPFH